MKSAYDGKHVKSVSAFALLYDGQHAGNIVANWSDNPNGSVVTTTVNIWHGPFKDAPSLTGKAGGYGYDKLSTAVASALHSCPAVLPQDQITWGGGGTSAMRTWFESHGYIVCTVIGS